MATLVEERGLSKQVVEDYLMRGMNITQIARKHSLNWIHIAYFLERQEDCNSDLWKGTLEKRNIEVFSQIKKVTGQLWDWLDRLNKLAESEDPNSKDLLKYIKHVTDLANSLNQQTKTYMDAVKIVHDVQEQEQVKVAMLEAIKEADPEVGAKVLQKLKLLKEQQGLLKLS